MRRKARRVLILTPTALPIISGNSVTAERWRRGLLGKGLAVKVFPVGGNGASHLIRSIRAFQPDLVHLHHAYRTASLFLDPKAASIAQGIPMVLSPAGTDIHLDMVSPERREIVLEILQWARVIIIQNPATTQALAEMRPDLLNRTHDVPKSVLWFGNTPCDLREKAGWKPSDVLFFLPAGIRPVKGNLEALRFMEELHRMKPQCRVLFSGMILDPVYGRRFAKEIIARRSLARWIPPLPLSAMRSAYESADIILNASLAEGLSNSLLEAMAAGRPILASDIPGNRIPLQGDPGEPSAGILFRPKEPEDFIAKAVRLIDNPEEREALALSARRRAEKWPTLEDEAEGLIQAYSRALL